MSATLLDATNKLGWTAVRIADGVAWTAYVVVSLAGLLTPTG
jgi:hypothetical protein